MAFRPAGANTRKEMFASVVIPRNLGLHKRHGASLVEPATLPRATVFQQNYFPHQQVMCLQTCTCSISMPQAREARGEGHPTTPTMVLRWQLRRILRRLSSPEHSSFPGKQKNSKQSPFGGKYLKYLHARLTFEWAAVAGR